MADTFDPYYTWLGIPPADQPPHHYRLLGVNLFEPNADAIANAADRQMAHVKAQATGQYTTASQRLLTELTQAKLCLLNSQKRAAYDERLKRLLASLSTPVVPVEDESEGSSLPGLAFMDSLATKSTAARDAKSTTARDSKAKTPAAGTKAASQPVAKAKKKPPPPPLPAPVRIGLQVTLSGLTLLVAYVVFGLISPQLDVLHWFHNSPSVEVADHTDKGTGEPSKTPPKDKTPDKSPEKAPDKTPDKTPDKSPEKAPDKSPDPKTDKTDLPPNGEIKTFPDPPPDPTPPDPPKKVTPTKPPGKSRVPDDAARRAAEGTLAEKISGATPQDLINEAALAKTPAESYVLLFAARETAAKTGDFDTTWKAAQQIIDRFEVKPWEAKAETVLLFQPGEDTVETCAKVAEQAIKSADENIAKKQWDIAERCAALALTAGRRANLPDLVRQATLKLVECRKGRGK